MKNNQLADQFIPVYGPATPFSMAPLFHITLADAKRLRNDGDAEFCSRSKALRLHSSAISRTDILVFALPEDEVTVSAIEEGGNQQPDKFWHGSSLRPNKWLMDANAWDMFWARVVTSAWHGFVRGTKGQAQITMTQEQLSALPVYRCEI